MNKERYRIKGIECGSYVASVLQIVSWIYLCLTGLVLYFFFLVVEVSLVDVEWVGSRYYRFLSIVFCVLIICLLTSVRCMFCHLRFSVISWCIIHDSLSEMTLSAASWKYATESITIVKCQVNKKHTRSKKIWFWDNVIYFWVLH